MNYFCTYKGLKCHIKESSQIKALLKATELLKSQQGISIEFLNDICIREVKEFITIYGDYINYNENTITTIDGQKFDLFEKIPHTNYRQEPQIIVNGIKYNANIIDTWRKF